MNSARINFIACFILALLKMRTVNLTQIADAFPGVSEKESKYKRIQRFFKDFYLDMDLAAKLIFELLPFKISKWTLTMDRTNWKFGKLNINIMMLGIAYEGAAFPLLWILLPKRGNSNTSERIFLIDWFIRLFGSEKVDCLTADREFIGEEWFSYLLKTCIKFRIRIKENMLISNSRGILVPAKQLFMGLKPGELHILDGVRSVLGHKLFIIGLLLQNGEYLILVTNDDPESALEDYKKRWEIETLFGCFKTRGFNFEDTHMTNLDRISKLIFFLAIAFCWCENTGSCLAKNKKKIQVKKHGRKSKSLFRHGLDKIRGILLNVRVHKKDLKIIIFILFKYWDRGKLINFKANSSKSKILSCT
jgi:hypothetical protein